MLEQLFLEHGPYWAYGLLFLGSLVEGESFVLTAGFLSYKKFLSFPLIVAISFGASVFADQLIFFAGRHYGPKYIDKHPRLKKSADRAFTLLHKYNVWFILGFRFLYGIRTLSPFVIGASGISIKRFMILNIISGAFWAIISCSAGYLLGYFFADALEEGIQAAAHYQWMALGVLAGIIILIVAIVYLKRRRAQKDETQEIL